MALLPYLRRILSACLVAWALPGPLWAGPASRLLAPAVETLTPRVIHDWDGAGGWKRLTVSATGQPEAGIRYQPAGLDLRDYAEVAVPVRNPGTRSLRVWLRVTDTSSGAGSENPRSGRSYEAVVPPSAEPVWLFVLLGGDEAVPYAHKLIAFRHAPPDFVRPGVVRAAAVTGVALGLADGKEGETVEVGPVLARGQPVPLRALPEPQAFPMFDEYGQYVHRDWPGKIHSDLDLAEAENREAADLLVHPRPMDWNQYGGWTAGPQLKATGYFRTEKVDGKWWLVDPEGRLFWSHGIVRVGTRIRVGGIYRGSPILDREYLFKLPARDSALGKFYGTEPASTRLYYEKHPDHPVYDFLEANLSRKYGPDWEAQYAEKAQRRLASWGLNTIANSSDPRVYLMRKTPYTAIVYSAPLGFNDHRIEGSGGNWGRLPDPFDPGWQQLMRRTLQNNLKDSINDPWCLGFFVDNELAWGDTFHIAESVLRSPASQPAKEIFRRVLEAKYGDIGRLNTAWGMNHASWGAWLESRELPARALSGAAADLQDFSHATIEAYFKGCRDAIAAVAPNHLYLGVRFTGSTNRLVMGIATKYCDVISINPYRASVEWLSLDGHAVDRPMMVTEFHFGALDRGPFGSALVPVADQEARALAYRGYVASALHNPAIVGTHWFQFFDQPPSGRFDTENYQTGFVDIADTPYEETIAASREMARRMYPLRYQGR